MTWEDAWQGFGLALAISVVALIGTALTSDKYVDGYYLSTGDGVTCVKSHWTWNSDQMAFCSDDYSKALDFAAKANGLLKK